MAGNDFIAVSGGKVAQDFHFARGQLRQQVVGAGRRRGDQRLHQAAGHFRGEYIVSVNGLADAFQEEVSVDVFQQKAFCTHTHTFGQVVAVFGNSQHDDGQLRIDAQNLSQCFAAVHDRHIQVQQNYVRLELFDHFYAGQAV